MFQYVVIIFLSFAGFFLGHYLHHKKKEKKERFICPLKGKCAEVINSDFSKFFGIPVEFLGMAYYAAIGLGYGILISVPLTHLWLTGPLLVASFFAFLFSGYLTFIQVVALQKLCTWCLLSAGFTTLIFVFSVYGSLATIVPFLDAYHEGFILIHLMAVALGLGAATLADVFFFRFLRDFRISESEASVLSVISEFIWLALGIIVITGFALYLPDAANYNQNPKFLMKMIIVIVIIVNGACLNLLVAPKMVKISFGEKHNHQKGELQRIRRIAFALGPISIVSWYSAFVLGALREVHFEFVELVLIYSALIATGLLAGRLVEQYYVRQARHN